jgi:alpha-methylacyl-CoA racemase
MPQQRSGPLTAFRIIELAGIGPVPFCGMLLSDLGAELIRVDRVADAGVKTPTSATLGRGRRSIAIDLKNPDGVALLLRLAERADALLEGYRPGVAERLGFGPEVCLARNRRLVYGRMTGYGQTGPWAKMAGHDVNYIALSGALAAIGRAGQAPALPLNLVGDFGGGAMLLAVGVLAALLEAQRSGEGQVIDVSMVEGSALLMTLFYEMLGQGSWSRERGSNIVDSGAPYYDVFETRDGGYVSLGSIEPQFFAELLARLEIDFDAARQTDRAAWPELRKRIAEAVARRTRAEWEERLAGTDVCFAPVLDMAEAPQHSQNAARGSFLELGGVTQPAPAPRFSRTPGRVARPAPLPGEHGAEILRDQGLGEAEIERLLACGAVRLARSAATGSASRGRPSSGP